MVHTVVVVTGTVVGTVVVGVVVVVTGFVAVVLEELPDCDVLVVGGVVDVVGVSSDDVEESSDDVEVLPVVEGTVAGVVATGFAAPAKYITVSPESAAEPTRRAWVIRRTRANRRSRC